jgi:hypothetical protein
VEALIGLAGALIGGVLVLIGDMVRYRIEWRRESARRLLDASTGLAMLFNRMCGEIVDAKKRSASPTALPPEHPEREEAVTRFFLTPGSEKLAKQASRLIAVYHSLFDRYSDADFGWEEARAMRREAIYAFEAGVREVLQKGRI